MKQSHTIFSQVTEEMMSRLELMTIKPEVILQVGVETDYTASLLQQRYPNAKLFNDQSSLAPESVNLIVANLFLPWCEDWLAALQEWHHLLRPEGLLLLSCFGPDTSSEILSTKKIIIKDMHDLGDMLIHAHFSDPVMDVDYQVLDCYEVVYGHAWKSGKSQGYTADEEGVVRVPVSRLTRNPPDA